MPICSDFYESNCKNYKNLKSKVHCAYAWQTSEVISFFSGMNKIKLAIACSIGMWTSKVSNTALPGIGWNDR